MASPGSALRGKVAIVGAADTEVGVLPGRTPMELCAEAALKAILTEEQLEKYKASRQRRGGKAQGKRRERGHLGDLEGLSGLWEGGYPLSSSERLTSNVASGWPESCLPDG